MLTIVKPENCKKNYANTDNVKVIYFALLLLAAQETLKRQRKIAADDILIFYFYLSKKIRLDFSRESSA